MSEISYFSLFVLPDKGWKFGLQNIKLHDKSEKVIYWCCCYSQKLRLDKLIDLLSIGYLPLPPEFIKELFMISELYRFNDNHQLLKVDVLRFRFSKIKFLLNSQLKSIEFRKIKNKLIPAKLSILKTRYLVRIYWEKFISQSINKDEFNRISYLAQD